ncbi:MAG: B12-binding domain-containing radical SAM protein [Gemmatimonadetes bacterium]|nr:B12-binding domain-containing radical SAM protein [Gemmatimonadota bacterium]
MNAPLLQIESAPSPSSAEPRRGLLIAPEFPASSFWSFRHVMEMVGKKAAFPPLGLITFAALMPDSWSFELIDLNVERVPDAVLRERIAGADAVFASAMSVQKPSLVRLLDGPARGLDTPWVLGGPYPSSFRDHLLRPPTPSDEILHRGLDLLVWGEAQQWVESIDRILRSPDGSRHSDERPTLLIPDAIAEAPPGDRKVLNDRTIFQELEDTPLPRWDLLDVRDYRALMIQTTIGCRFRCEFCDIIRFNGGFTRPKTLASVRRELEALHDLGHRGGVFTVDDNFIGNPRAIEAILQVMIEFQRERDYPFSFYTQASLDLGTPKLAHLLPLMKQAGFAEVFLGIENPDPEALREMNKKQNVMVDIAETVATIQASGIEVMAGFIFGSDADTPETAAAIAEFADEVAIPTAMTGMLTPIPHTPLAERLAEEGRLREAEYSGNNTDDEVQFLPAKMTMEEMKRGYHAILERLFAPGEMYRRAGALLDRLQPHIFRGGGLRRSDLRAAWTSLWRQGLSRSKRARYLALLWKAVQLDRTRAREARRAAAEVERRLRTLSREGRARLPDLEVAHLSELVEKAREAMVRADPGRRLDDVSEWTAGLGERIAARTPTAEDLATLRRWGREFFVRQRRVHRFPGAYLVKAFELAIKGLHYETVMRGMVTEESRGAR